MRSCTLRVLSGLSNESIETVSANLKMPRGAADESGAAAAAVWVAFLLFVDRGSACSITVRQTIDQSERDTKTRERER